MRVSARRCGCRRGSRWCGSHRPSGTKVEVSLATLRGAIADLRGALGTDPGNLLLQEMLVNSYQDEIRVPTAVKAAGVAGQEI